MSITEQRGCIKFCSKNEINATKTFQMMQTAFVDQCLSRKNIFKWYKLFQEGRESIEDEARSGRPSTSVTPGNVQTIKEKVMENRHLTVRELADDVGISIGSVDAILSDVLGLKRLSAKLIPKSLDFLQKQHRIDVAKEMLEQVENDPTFIQRIITGDETWVYQFDMLTKQQSSEWRYPNEPRPKRIRQTQSKIKTLLTVFMDYRGVVHHEFLAEGCTVNKHYYLQVMRRLREAIRQKRPDLWEGNSWFLHHDNAPSHNAIIIREFLAKNSTNVISHAPYSPDMSPCDFFLFDRLKKPLRGTRFDSVEAIKQKSQDELMNIPKSDFEKCFLNWIKRWRMCIATGGEYFEGDKINFG